MQENVKILKLMKNPMNKKGTTWAIYRVDNNVHIPLVYLRKTDYATEKEFEEILRLFEK